MPSLITKPKKYNNKVYSSVKLLSTTKAINTAIDRAQKSMHVLSSSNKKFNFNSNSIIRNIKNELKTISGCNTVIESEIAPSLSCTSASQYCHKRIINAGPDRLYHVDSATLVTPEKQAVPYKSNTRTRDTKNSTTTTTSGYKLIPVPLNGFFLHL